MRYTDLVAAKKAADEALEKFEDDLRWENVLAKEAYRKKPTEKNRERKLAAAKALQEARAISRRNRPLGTGGIVGGDAFLSPDQNGG